MARCVLPVPGLPMKHALVRCSIQSPRASSSTLGLLKEGTALKSKVSKSLATVSILASAS